MSTRNVITTLEREVGWALGWGFNIWLPRARYRKQKGF